MKKKVLGIFKYHRPWNADIIGRFSNFYATSSLYISDYTDKNFSEIIDDINNFIKSNNIEIVLFDVDYFKFINFFFIERIKVNKKILVTGDDFDQHEMHSLTASACDILLSHCPLSVLKFREKGYEAHPINFEIVDLDKNNEKKDIDVLFFGVITPGRKEFLDFISQNNISIKNVGHEESGIGLKKEELMNLISRAKIVLNLSKSRTTSVQNHASESTYYFYYQFKGRVILTGLQGSLCVSEYSPGQEIIFHDNEIPTFFNKEECVEMLKNLLKNESLFEEKKNKFISKVKELYDEKKIFTPINESIEKLNNRKVKLVKFPYWYLRIAAKQTILRNISLLTLIKNMLQINVIFSMVKKSNILVKLLIILESIINILWYSFIRTLKSKK